MARQYRIFIECSQYSRWRIIDNVTFDNITLSKVEPLKEKFFNNDIFEYHQENNMVSLVSSPIRTQILSGVLITERTYGKYKDKFLYRCMPHDRHIPEFLVPYNMKMGFQKNHVPIYICFKYKHWDEKHPRGEIIRTIGPVNILGNFYEYQLACKNLDITLKEFTKNAKERMKHLPTTEIIDNIIAKYGIIDRREQTCYTIDNNDTIEFDDAFSLWNETKEDGKEYQTLSVYISNVSFWMEELKLWDAFSQRIATIYLPDQKRPMLPTILSDCICSLKKGEQRIVFTMDITRCLTDTEIPPEYTFKNSLIIVKDNLQYDSWKKNKEAKSLCQDAIKFASEISKDPVRNARDLVYFMMVYMNHMVSCEMIKYKNGIYRSVKTVESNTDIPKNLPSDVYSYLKFLKSSIGQYVVFNDMKYHNHLELDTYLHISSPIRRLVDLLNLIQIQENLNLFKFTDSAYRFYGKWISKLDYINTTMRSIRKIQSDCNILSYFEDETNLEKTYTGYLFDKVRRTDLMYQYNVYIPQLKLTTRFNSLNEYNNYEKYSLKLFIFKDEYSIRKKVKVQCIEKDITSFTA